MQKIEIPKNIKKHFLIEEPNNSFNLLEPGYVFAPYIPMVNVDNSFRPRRGLLSRYGQTQIKNNYYTIIMGED